jgi:hypothetical protein
VPIGFISAQLQRSQDPNSERLRVGCPRALSRVPATKRPANATMNVRRSNTELLADGWQTGHTTPPCQGRPAGSGEWLLPGNGRPTIGRRRPLAARPGLEIRPRRTKILQLSFQGGPP